MVRRWISLLPDAKCRSPAGGGKGWHSGTAGSRPRAARHCGMAPAHVRYALRPARSGW